MMILEGLKNSFGVYNTNIFLQREIFHTPPTTGKKMYSIMNENC